MSFFYVFCLLFYVCALAGAFPGGCHVAAVGDTNTAQSCDAGAENAINEFLVSQAVDSISLDKFHIHGWRWHTLSLAREVKRLQKLAERHQMERSSYVDSKSLKQAADYVIGFNLKG